VAEDYEFQLSLEATKYGHKSFKAGEAVHIREPEQGSILGEEGEKDGDADETQDEDLVEGLEMQSRKRS
jgi:hypothetical protein